MLFNNNNNNNNSKSKKPHVITAALQKRSQVRHNNTSTTIKANELAKECQNKTVTILNKVKNRLRTIPGIALGQMKAEFGEQVHAAFNDCLTEVFMSAKKFTERFSGRRHELSASDLAMINSQTRDQEEGFWRAVADMISFYQFAGTVKPEELREQELAKGQRPDFQLRVENIAHAGVFGFLSKSTVFLLKDLKAKQQGVPANVPMFTPLKQEGGTIEARITALKPIDIPDKLLVIWVTEGDVKVCPICMALDGRTFDIDDPTTPQPVRDTHPKCRCRLLPVAEGGNVFNG